MTTTIDTPVKATADELAVAEALGRINVALDGLRNLARLVQARPDIARSIQLHMYDINIALGTNYGIGGRDTSVPERIASLASDAADHGADVRQHQRAGHGGVMAQFGPVPLHVYATLDEVGQRTTRTVEVTEWQPNPLLAAFAPGVSE